MCVLEAGNDPRFSSISSMLPAPPHVLPGQGATADGAAHCGSTGCKALQDRRAAELVVRRAFFEAPAQWA
jgi:hypothetical protein